MIIRKAWSWIGNNDKQIQVLMIILLILITLFYAISTYNMASIMKEEYKDLNTPFVSVIVKPSFSNSVYSQEILVINSGNVPVRIKQTEVNFVADKRFDNTINSSFDVLLGPGNSASNFIVVEKMDEEYLSFNRIRVYYSSINNGEIFCQETLMSYIKIFGFNTLSSKTC
ncbi:MAG: hypothetical protein ABIH49_02050 [archaeon]